MAKHRDGDLGGDTEHKDIVEQTRAEEAAAEKRKRGGHIFGKAPKDMPNKRARGGAMPAMNPTTKASHMSTPSFTRKNG